MNSVSYDLIPADQKILALMHIIMYISVQNEPEYVKMKIVNFTDFRKKASTYFSDVEKGETLVIIRHGKAIAEISPAEETNLETPSWKKPGLKLTSKGASLSYAILEERAASDRE